MRSTEELSFVVSSEFPISESFRADDSCGEEVIDK